MSDYRDTRGGACDHVNDFETRSLRRCETPKPRTKKRSGARTCGPNHCLVPRRAIRCRRA